MIAAPFHAGERTLQALAGSREQMEVAGPRVIRDYMPDQHREFFSLLPFIVAGSLDEELQPWASVLAGPTGFVHSPDPTHLRIEALPAAGDPLIGQLKQGATLGLLGIQPHTRRRNRMNGSADTLFIATAYPDEAAAGDGADASSHGVDVSHRGGRPGFVRIDGDDTLILPDFNGNRFFNTLGNLAVHPRAGLLFVDFDSGDLLHVAATAEIVWNGPEVDAFEGAERLVRFHVTHALRRPGALPLRWGDAQLSPHLAGTGQWNTGMRPLTDGR